jgi:RsiW-degrading membrane proteinase PrsW (M82 family)
MSDDTIGSSAVCERCGGSHTRRQRCPLDPPAVERIADAAPAAETAPAWQPAYLPQRAPAASMAPLRPAPALRTAGQWEVARPFTFPRRARPRTPWWRSTLRWFGAVTGSIALLTCVSVASVFVSRLTQVEQRPATALAAIFISLGAGLAAMGVLYVSSRVYAKIVFALLSLYLITAGFMMLVIAPVIRQMNTPELAEYRGFAALVWFGAVSLVCGLGLGAACLRWALRPHALRRIGRWSRLLGSGYGVLQGLSGVIAILTLLSLINASSGPLDDTSIVERAISITALAMWALAPGILLTYHGISSSMGEGSGEFRPPVALYPLLAWGAVLLAGWWAMASDDPVAAPMPLLHALAAVLPGVVLVALVARAGVLRGRPVRWLTWRQVTLAAAISMTVGVQIAIYVESIGSFGAVVLLLVHNGAFADALTYADVQETIGQSRFILTHNEQFAANLVTAAVLAPLSEEFAKGLGVRFMMRRDMTRAQAFVLGAAAGAGFGFLEALLYGLAGIGHHHLGHWPLIMLIRGGSTSLHVFNTGLVGLAWWYWSIGRRPRAGWALFAAAVGMHALWNGFAVTLDSRILGIDTLSDRIIEWVAYGVTGAIAIVLVLALPAIARSLRDERSLVEGTPLAAMAPWLG